MHAAVEHRGAQDGLGSAGYNGDDGRVPHRFLDAHGRDGVDTEFGHHALHESLASRFVPAKYADAPYRTNSKYRRQLRDGLLARADDRKLLRVLRSQSLGGYARRSTGAHLVECKCLDDRLQLAIAAVEEDEQRRGATFGVRPSLSAA